jgi:hypothetical protein
MDRENTNAMKTKDDEEEDTSEFIEKDLDLDDELAKMLRKDEIGMRQKQLIEDNKVKAAIQATITNIKKL